jgi:hypothetical protein
MPPLVGNFTSVFIASPDVGVAAPDGDVGVAVLEGNAVPIIPPATAPIPRLMNSRRFMLTQPPFLVNH